MRLRASRIPALLLRHRCPGRRRARPPAHRPRCELRSARRLEARALRPRRCPPHWWRVVRVARPGLPHVQPSHPLNAEHPTNFACNSLVTISNLEFAALELQRFLTLLNLRPIELHATFGGALAVRWRSSHW